MMNRELSGILDLQTAWSQRHGIEINDSRHTGDLEANLFRPLSSESMADLRVSTRRPLGDVSLRGEETKPCDLQLLESTLALVCNVFDADRHSPGALAAACGGDSRADVARFCAPVTAGGMDGEVDLLFASAEADDAAPKPTAVNACYAEPYRSARPRRAPFNRVSSSLIETEGVWATLPMCRRLALDLRVAPQRFEHVAVAELLSLGIGLTAQYGYRGFKFVHLWYDAGGASAARVRDELDRFRFRVGGELDFVSLSWQQLLARLSTPSDADLPETPAKSARPETRRAALDPLHLRYLQDRYALDESSDQ